MTGLPYRALSKFKFVFALIIFFFNLTPPLPEIFLGKSAAICERYLPVKGYSHKNVEKFMKQREDSGVTDKRNSKFEWQKEI